MSYHHSPFESTLERRPETVKRPGGPHGGAPQLPPASWPPSMASRKPYQLLSTMEMLVPVADWLMSATICDSRNQSAENQPLMETPSPKPGPACISPCQCPVGCSDTENRAPTGLARVPTGFGTPGLCCNSDAFRVSETDSKQIEKASLLYTPSGAQAAPLSKTRCT